MVFSNVLIVVTVLYVSFNFEFNLTLSDDFVDSAFVYITAQPDLLAYNIT